MWDVSGTSGAAPIWAAVMNMLHKTEPSRAPTPPPGVVQSRTAFGSQIEATRSEWFIEGTEQALFAINSGATQAYTAGRSGQKRLDNSAATPEAAPRITAPVSGTIIALDPDIPPNRQRLSFTAEGQAVRWLMDGKAFARGPQAQWLPWPGRHVVQLVDARGAVLDEIKIEVRGAGLKAASK
jgi:penicillin-binding protein 1C